MWILQAAHFLLHNVYHIDERRITRSGGENRMNFNHFRFEEFFLRRNFSVASTASTKPAEFRCRNVNVNVESSRILKSSLEMSLMSLRVVLSDELIWKFFKFPPRSVKFIGLTSQLAISRNCSFALISLNLLSLRNSKWILFLLHFVLGYLEQGLLVRDAKKLRQHYFSTSHWRLDIISMLPTDLGECLYQVALIAHNTVMLFQLICGGGPTSATSSGCRVLWSFGSIDFSDCRECGNGSSEQKRPPDTPTHFEYAK